MDEKRRDERFTKKIKSEIYSEDGLTFSSTVDMSQGGLFISTPEPLHEGSEIKISVLIPGNDDTVDIKGRVKWIREDEDDSKKSGMGIEFIDLSSENAELLKKSFD